MQFEIQVGNVAGVERATLKSGGIILIGGSNAAGKSSLLRAVAAAAMADPLPIPGMTKGGAGAFVRTGADRGFVKIITGSGEAGIEWPSAQVSSKGEHVRAGGLAVGAVDLPTMDARKRAGVLAAYIKAVPSRDDLVAALSEIGIVEPERKEGESDEDYIKRNPVDRVWAKASSEGWDSAWTHAKELGAQLKGAFQQITRTAWGSDKGGKWVPPGWSIDLIDNDPVTLEATAKLAQTGLDAAIEAAAVSTDKRTGLQATADTLAQATKDHEAATAALEPAKKAIKDAEAARGALVSPGQQPDVVCCPHPKCGGEIEIKRTLEGYEVALPAKKKRMSKAEVKAAEDAIKAADEAINLAMTTERNAQNAVSGAFTRMQMAKEAKIELDKLGAAPEPGAKPAAQSVDEAREVSASAERRLAMRRQWDEAQKIHATLIRNQKIVDILAPDGLRRLVMGRQLEAFNTKQLKPLCERAGWKAVEIDQDMAITYGGRSYAFLADSEQLKVKYVLQVACAISDGSTILVLDKVDTLMPDGRKGLIKMVMDSGRYAVLGCSYPEKGLVPDLAAAGLGTSYWLDNGIAEQIGAPAKAA